MPWCRPLKPALALRKTEVSKKDYQQSNHQGYLWNHFKKFTVIHRCNLLFTYLQFTIYYLLHHTDGLKDVSSSRRDDIAHPEGERAKACHTENETDDGDALVPCSIRQFKVVLVLHLAIEDLADHAQDIDCRDDNRHTGDDGGHHAERVVGVAHHRLGTERNPRRWSSLQ